jgi:hypothetical protein
VVIPIIGLAVLLAAGGRGPGAENAVGFYDPGLQRVVLVGGPGDAKHGDRDSVWSWTGKRWELHTDSGPQNRVNAAVAYDHRRRIAVVCGGSRKSADGSSREVVGDCWEGSGRGAWKRVADIPPLDHQAMVAGVDGSLLMFGGIPGVRSAPWPSDTRELREGAWTPVASEGPRGRARTALAYDAKRRQVVLFGGVSAEPQVFLQDTWIWAGGKWTLAAEGGPPGRYAHGMVFDERAGVVLLYSGSAAHSGAPLSDMWQWDGQRWSEIPLTGPTPGYRYQPVMVYDRARKRTVLYGGLDGFKDDTWEWDGRRWREVKP